MLKLSESIISGLQNLGNVINTELSKKLIANVVKLSLYSDGNIPPNPEIYASKQDYAKQSEFAAMALLLLAVQEGYDGQKLRGVLEQYALPSIIIDEITNKYEENRSNLIVQSLKTGHLLPYVTDAEWKLHCDIKSLISDSDYSELKFTVNLRKYKESTGEKQTTVEFVCNSEELQSLINQLKIIETHCQRKADYN